MAEAVAYVRNTRRSQDGVHVKVRVWWKVLPMKEVAGGIYFHVLRCTQTNTWLLQQKT
jgi:hypothetical protein